MEARNEKAPGAANAQGLGKHFDTQAYGTEDRPAIESLAHRLASVLRSRFGFQMTQAQREVWDGLVLDAIQHRGIQLPGEAEELRVRL